MSCSGHFDLNQACKTLRNVPRQDLFQVEYMPVFKFWTGACSIIQTIKIHQRKMRLRPYRWYADVQRGFRCYSRRRGVCARNHPIGNRQHDCFERHDFLLNTVEHTRKTERVTLCNYQRRRSGTDYLGNIHHPFYIRTGSVGQSRSILRQATMSRLHRLLR